MRLIVPTPRATVLVPVLAALSALCPGCASSWREPGTQPAIAAEPQQGDARSDAPRRTTGQVDLEAIEDFLERTKDYAVRQAPPKPTDERPEPARAPEWEHRARATPPATSTSSAAEKQDAARANAQMTLAEPPAARPQLALPVLQTVSVAEPTRPDAPKSEPPKTRTTNAALNVEPEPSALSWEDLLQQLRDEANAGADIESLVRLRLVLLAMDRTDEALRPAPGLTEETNALVRATLRAVTSVRDFLQDPMATGDEPLEAADELHRQLADRADPVVSSVALCRRVVTFGVYEEMASSEFVAGRTIPTIVYCEVDNLRSTLTGDGRYETRLGTRLELLTSDGESVWQTEEPDIVDRCRRQRTDFFIAQRVTLPPTLPAGEYVLKVFVEDKLSGRASEATHPFPLQSAVSVARTP